MTIVSAASAAIAATAASAVKKAAPAPVKPPSRMSLANVTRGRRANKPWLLLVHGIDGVGKSSLAAGFPKPIFLGPEKGSDHLDVARFPVPETWQDVLDAVRGLTDDEHDYQTLAIDSWDWLEPILVAHVCKLANVDDKEKIGGGFGKWADAAIDHLRVLFAAIERMQDKRGIHVIGLAHTIVKAFKNPQGADFDRYEIACSPKIAAVLRQWVEAVLFANYETFAVTEKKRTRGVSTKARWLYTQREAAFDAKDRYGLPERVALDAQALFEARANAQAITAELRAEVERKAADLGGEIATWVAGHLAKLGESATRQDLEKVNARLNAKLAERAEAQADSPANTGGAADAVPPEVSA